ncbi:MAG: helix-turn-helix transcriptional regulator [Spirochaetales bacterium]|nr:helix-turn-helix transcriptional regulator [Spirochaetales bacterium]
MTEIQRILLSNIKKYRSLLKYSQFDLAELCGVSASYISEIETGKKYPSAKMLERLVQALEVKPYQLFLDENDIDNFNKEGFLSSFKEKIQDLFVSDVEILYSQFTDKDDN